MALRYFVVSLDALPEEVQRLDWVVRRSDREIKNRWQTCRYEDDDGAIYHFGFVQMREAQIGKWYAAIERLGQDVSMSS